MAWLKHPESACCRKGAIVYGLLSRGTKNQLLFVARKPVHIRDGCQQEQTNSELREESDHDERLGVTKSGLAGGLYTLPSPGNMLNILFDFHPFSGTNTLTLTVVCLVHSGYSALFSGQNVFEARDFTRVLCGRPLVDTLG